MTDRIDKLRAALVRIRETIPMSNSAVETSSLSYALYDIAYAALAEDDRDRLCAPAEVAPRTVGLCPNPQHGPHCCDEEPPTT